jgi:hypothetical protein
MAATRSRSSSPSGGTAHDEADEAPVLREILGVLLEVRAYVEAHGAQLERARAQLERLDARASSLELGATRRSTASAGARRSRPAAAAREQRPTLLDLSSDVVDNVVTCLAPDDELAASLACRKLRDALRGARSRAGRTLQTRVRSLLGSLGKLQWGAACAGAPLTIAVLDFVAGRGDLRMLSWLRARGCQWYPNSGHAGGPCAEAARAGHLAVVQWLRANGCPWNEETCARAAEGGHLSVLRWARANGCPWHGETCSIAAKGGHLSVLQWARANGCSWGCKTCERAAQGGHLAVLQWARANGCQWDSYVCRRGSQRRSPVSAAVGARQRLPLGRGDVCLCC